MGSDKALLTLNGQTLLAHGLRKLEAVCTSVTIVSNHPAHEACGNIIADIQPESGPLAAIIAALEHTTTESNLILAVDTPFVPEEVLMKLIATAQESEAPFTLAAANQQIHPLCGVYRKRAATSLRAHFEAGNRTLIEALYQAGPVTRVEFSEENWFRNLNTPADYLEATKDQ